MPRIPIDEPLGDLRLVPSPPKQRQSAPKSKRKKVKTSRDTGATARTDRGKKKAGKKLATDRLTKKLTSKKRKGAQSVEPTPTPVAHKLVQCALPWSSHAPSGGSWMNRSAVGNHSEPSSQSASVSFGAPEAAAASEPVRNLEGKQPAAAAAAAGGGQEPVLAAGPPSVASLEPSMPVEPPAAPTSSSAAQAASAASAASAAAVSFDSDLEPAATTEQLEENEALRGELAEIRAEMAALRVQPEPELSDRGNEDDAGARLQGRPAKRVDVGTQASLPWRGHGGWLMTPGWNATTRPMGKIYDEAEAAYRPIYDEYLCS